MRAGLQGKLNVSSAFNLFIEPQLALYPDRVDNQSSWKRYNLAGSLMAGITYKPAGYATLTFLKGGFASLAAGTGNTGNVLFDTEFALGKWFDKFNGMRISAGSSTAFLDNEDSGSNRDLISASTLTICAASQGFFRSGQPRVQPDRGRRHRELFSWSGIIVFNYLERTHRTTGRNQAIGT